MTAAFLWAQLERAAEITARRLEIWNHYHGAFAEAERRGRSAGPSCRPNAPTTGTCITSLLPTIEGAHAPSPR